MPTRLSVAQRNAHADLAADAVDASATLAGYVEIYSGTQPATVATAASGTLLATFTLNDPAYGAAASGVATLNVSPVPSSTWLADYSGAAWFRVYDGDGVALRDGVIASVSAVASDAAEVESGSITMPESGV